MTVVLMLPNRSIWAAPEEPDVDQAALQVEAEQLEHAHDRRRAGDDRRVADRQRQPGRPGPEDAGLVDELEVRRDGPLGEVDRDVRQPDADEADALAGELARRGHDHHLGLAEGRGLDPGARSRDRLDVRVDGLAEPPRDGDHPVRALGRAADPEARIAALEDALGDRVEDLLVRRLRGRPAPASSISGSANHSPMTGRWPRR